MLKSQETAAKARCLTSSTHQSTGRRSMSSIKRKAEKCRKAESQQEGVAKTLEVLAISSPKLTCPVRSKTQTQAASASKYSSLDALLGHHPAVTRLCCSLARPRHAAFACLALGARSALEDALKHSSGSCAPKGLGKGSAAASAASCPGLQHAVHT